MFVKLFTGLPGAGKTAQLVAELLRFQKEEANRPRFAMGINGLKDGLANALTQDELEKWWELPPGSVLFIDEAQEEHLMPKVGKEKEWVKKIAKVRHHGMTFVLTTQHPQNMSPFVCRLVDQHVHTVEKFRTGVIMKYTWGRCMDTPEKPFSQKSAVESIGTLPKEVFELYTSASLHTAKRRIPRKVYIFCGLVVCAIAACIAAPILIKRANDKNLASISGVPATDSQAKSVTNERKSVDDELRVKNYAKWMAPRVSGQPWTAPAFDQLQVKAEPRVYCIANEDGGCHCRTEQGTRYNVEANVCRAMVNEGGVYNPFQPPADRPQQQQEHEQGERQVVGGVASLMPSVHRYRAGTGTAAYTPPELTEVSSIGAQ
jgi:hypothetical protein